MIYNIWNLVHIENNLSSNQARKGFLKYVHELQVIIRVLGSR